MDLLDTVLRNADALSYLEAFRKLEITTSVLSTLSDRDLEIIGVDNEGARKRILAKASTLIIPQEENLDIVIDSNYMVNTLGVMSRNLKVHYASIVCAVAREDVILCNVKLNNATKTLSNCLSSLENQLERLEQKIVNKKNSGTRKRNFVVGFALLGTSSLGLFLIAKFVLK